MIAPTRGAPGDPQRSAAEGSGAKTSDFEEWLFWQSNVMLDLSLEHQKLRYRDDDAWHQRSDARPYRSKA